MQVWQDRQRRVTKWISIAEGFIAQRSPPAALWLQVLGHLVSLEKLVPYGRVRIRPLAIKTALEPEVRSPVLSGSTSPKGAKVYPASRRRSNKRVGLKRQLAPHCVPGLKNSIMAYKRLSTSLGSKTLNNTSSSGLGGTKT